MIFSKKRESNKNLLLKLWNEFLFAREFEYETPLTPDEMAGAMRAIERLEHGSWILSAAKLEHKLRTERHSDKAIDFKIDLEEDKNSVWSSRMNLLYSEGSIMADPLRGMSIVKGRTQFSGQYYIVWLLIFAFNIFSQMTMDIPWLGWFWLGSAMFFWFAMYQERNKLADTLDTIIMHAKSERSAAILMGESEVEEDLSEAETRLETQAGK